MRNGLLKRAGNDSQKELIQILKNRNKALLLPFVLNTEIDEIEGLPRQWVVELSNQMAEMAESFKPYVKLNGGAPDLLLPSRWEGYDLTKSAHFPMRVIDVCWDLENLIDEYFGACYSHREGPGERFEENARTHFAQLIKQKCGSGLAAVKKSIEWAQEMCFFEDGYHPDDCYTIGVLEFPDRMQLDEVDSARVEALFMKEGVL